jgi:hypothetical protein
MFSRFVTIALLGLALSACKAKDDSTTGDPGGPVDIQPTNRDVVDAGLIVFDLDADVFGRGGSTGVSIPDAGPHRDLAQVVDAAVDLGGMGAVCDVFVAKSCASDPTNDLGCYPKPDGTGTCQQAGSLFGGSNCDPSSSSRDSKCVPGYVCVVGFCTALCHLGRGSATECHDSIGSTCVHLGSSDNTTVGYCASD